MRSTAVQRVLRDGRPIHGRRVVVFLAPGTGEVAMVAGRKIGGAVRRNRARRILRAAVRELAPRGFDDRDVVLVARETINGARAQDLAEELTQLLGAEVPRR